MGSSASGGNTAAFGVASSTSPGMVSTGAQGGYAGNFWDLSITAWPYNNSGDRDITVGGDTGGMSVNHTHQYYLPSHRNWIMTRATTTGSSHVHPEKQYAHRHWIKLRNTSAGTTHTHPISGHTGAVCAADGTTAATHLHLISGSTANGDFANTALNNEPQYMNVIYLIRVK